MDHAVSAFHSRSERISPTAVALAVLLHAMVLLGLWWLSQHLPKDDFDDAIQVSFEEAKPPPPKPLEPPKPEVKQQPKPEPKPDPKSEPKPQPQLIEALKPPAPITADKATQVPPKGDKPKDADLAPPPPPLVDSLPAPEPDPPAPTAAEIAKMEQPPAAPEPAPPQEAKPAPPALTGDLPKPPPPPAPAQPQQQQALATPPTAPKPQPPARPMPQLHKPEYPPSLQSLAPSHKPPAGTRSEGDPSPSPFVNPADTYNRARVADNYLWQVVRKLQGYRYNAQVSAREGITVVRVVIARDGRLLNVAITRSSGYTQFDEGVLAGVRSGSPYAPLPPDIRGDSASFDLPLVSINRGR